MSTRSIIVFTNGRKTSRVYKHCDGYPTGNLAVIADALNSAKGSKSVNWFNKYVTSHNEYRAELEESQSGPFKNEILGNQCDLEWIYVVDLSAKTVNVYGGGFTGGLPQEHYINGLVDPISYTDCLRDEYKHLEGQEIYKQMYHIVTSGYRINQGGN